MVGKFLSPQLQGPFLRLSSGGAPFYGQCTYAGLPKRRGGRCGRCCRSQPAGHRDVRQTASQLRPIMSEEVPTIGSEVPPAFGGSKGENHAFQDVFSQEVHRGRSRLLAGVVRRAAPCSRRPGRVAAVRPSERRLHRHWRARRGCDPRTGFL